jgi:DNA-directed RNA polymerase specialized sigma24 family protein
VGNQEEPVTTPFAPRAVSPRVRSMQEREQALLARALRGETVRDEIILHLQPTIWHLARSLYLRAAMGRVSAHRGERAAIELADLVQAANVRMLETYPRALAQRKPLAWLRVVAANAMRDLLNGRASLIKREPGRPAIPLFPLNAPLGEQGLSLADLLAYDLRLPAPGYPATFDTVLQAVAALPGSQRTVIERAFGLHEHAPTPLRQLGREIPGASYHYRRALTSLRHTLYPWLAARCASTPRKGVHA